jgi:hypothetical protein
VIPSSTVSTVEFFFILQDGMLLLLETASNPVAMKLENELDYGSQRRKMWMWESVWWPVWCGCGNQYDGPYGVDVGISMVACMVWMWKSV